MDPHKDIQDGPNKTTIITFSATDGALIFGENGLAVIMPLDCQNQSLGELPQHIYSMQLMLWVLTHAPKHVEQLNEEFLEFVKNNQPTLAS